ncbi:MAG: hypothetical protein K2M11_09895 [Paramuribaculum sp.]|nr:hypothetical protein [Paramuribaculum sp.]
MKKWVNVKSGLMLLGIALLVSLVILNDKISMWILAIMLGLSMLVLLGIIGKNIYDIAARRGTHLYAKDFPLKFLATLMGFFLIMGTMLYMYVFYSIGNEYSVEFTNAEYLFRSLISAINLFLFDVDSNILDRLDGHGVLKGWILVLAVLSSSCTVGMLVGLVYYRIRAYLRLHSIKINDSKNHLYLFFGNNTPTSLLVKDIIKRDEKAVVIVIDEANIKDEDCGALDSVRALVTHKRKIFSDARETGFHVALAGQQLADIDEKIVNGQDFDAFSYLGLSKIKSLIKKLVATKASQLHIFFMDEDEDKNIRNIMALAQDVTMAEVAEKSTRKEADEEMKHTIYCHARYNGPNKVIQDVAVNKKLEVRLVDSSHIAVELLKKDPECHPVKVVKLSETNPATVESPLNTLIVGFGEVGRYAFRFLYEFGSFVGSNSTDTEAFKSPFECRIADIGINGMKGIFKEAMPSIFGRTSYSTDKISFHSVDYNSDEFYADVLDEQYIRNLNYVVISIGDNDAAIALAARIFNRARRLGNDLSRLRIFVRCTSDDKAEKMQKIADHYNYGYGEGKNNIPVIRIFGQPKQTYTFDLVVNNSLIKLAKEYFNNYRELLPENNDDWETRRKKCTSGEVADIDKLSSLRRKEGQDVANALHGATKLYILKSVMQENTDWSAFYNRCFIEKDKGDFKEEKQIILRLAMLEHLRWNSAHELLGYRFNDAATCCDERTKLHNCLCSWQQLDVQHKLTGTDYKKYDFIVVKTSIAQWLGYFTNEQKSNQI